MLVWLVGGILSLLGALTYGELAARSPKAGGIYIYIRDCFSPLPAFLYGWTLFFVISSGSIATLAVAFSAYLGEIVPLTPALSKLIAVGMIAIVTVVNVLGTRKSCRPPELDHSDQSGRYPDHERGTALARARLQRGGYDLVAHGGRRLARVRLWAGDDRSSLGL